MGRRRGVDRGALNERMLVSEVIERHPGTIPVFARLQMACVGCAMAPMETIAEAASAYGMNVDELLRKLDSARRREKGRGR